MIIIQKYHLVVETSRKRFDEEISCYLNDGWKLHKSASAVLGPKSDGKGDVLHWIQAVEFIYDSPGIASGARVGNLAKEYDIDIEAKAKGVKKEK